MYLIAAVGGRECKVLLTQLTILAKEYDDFEQQIRRAPEGNNGRVKG